MTVKDVIHGSIYKYCYDFYNKSLSRNFKIQSVPLNCGSEKFMYLLEHKVFGEVPYIGKSENKISL